MVMHVSYEPSTYWHKSQSPHPYRPGPTQGRIKVPCPAQHAAAIITARCCAEMIKDFSQSLTESVHLPETQVLCCVVLPKCTVLDLKWIRSSSHLDQCGTYPIGLISFLAVFSMGRGLKQSGVSGAGTPPAPANTFPVQDALP